MTVYSALNQPDGSGMRRTMGRLLAGVSVVTSLAESVPVGMTISSLTMISLEPPVLMISLNRDTRTGGAAIASGTFAVSILGVRQEATARQFAVRGGTRFEDGEFELSTGGLPLIRGALAQIECSVHSHQQVGDHDVIFGTVSASRYREGDPLAFYSGRFGLFGDFNHDPAPWLF